MYRLALPAALTAVLVVASASSEAKVVSGELDLTGAVIFTSTLVDFTPAFGGSGRANIVDGSSGTFASLIGTTAIVKDIPLPPGGILDEITFPAAPLLHFNATSVGPGIFGSAQCALAPAVGQTCTLPGSPFNLTNVSQGSTLSFELDGNFVDLSDGKADPTPYHGIFTAQFIGKSYQQVLASIDAGQGAITSYSASFAPSVIPEASSVVMLSAGLLAFGAFGWRRSRHGSGMHKGIIERASQAYHLRNDSNAFNYC
jgi:hypothetical protein